MDVKWLETCDCVALALDEVRIWAVPLDAFGASPAELASLLTDEERQQAARFLREEVRRRFVVARASLRCILGSYMDMPASQVPIERDANGKPQLAARAETTDLQFNLAHSGELALVAVTRGCEVGVDAEQLRPIVHWQDIATRYFHPSESGAIDAVEPSARNEAFLRCWTRKEAILKALGVGLGHSLASFVVPIDEPAGQWVELPKPVGSAPRRYWLQSMVQFPGYVAAVATVQPKRIAFRYFQSD